MTAKKKNPFQVLSRVISEDSDYAWSLHCNIAMPIMDELGCTHMEANRAAARVMRMMFGIDTTTHWHFPKA